MMGKILGPISREDWLTMLMLKYDIRECSKLNNNGKFDLAIKANNKCLNLFFKDIYDNAA